MNPNSFASKLAVIVILVAGAAIGLSGIDLILPAIPTLPKVLSGTASMAQLVLASFTAGSGAGLLLFGRLGDYFERRVILISSFAIYGFTSAACALSSDMMLLVILRFVQGASGTAAAVFAPEVIRTLLDPKRAVRTIGVMGSIESLVPALAPLIGALLLRHFGWQSSFVLIAVLALALGAATFVLRDVFPPMAKASQSGSYWAVLRRMTFIRYAVSHALVLGGLLTFVFGAPTVIVNSMNGQLSDFIMMQMVGIASFIVAANVTSKVIEKIGAERTIHLGTLLTTASAVAILVYALTINSHPRHLVPLFAPLNAGFGLRGPPGFFRAVVAAGGDDRRGSALLILTIMATAACGTVLVAPFINQGLPALATVTTIFMAGALAVLKFLPPLREEEL